MASLKARLFPKDASSREQLIFAYGSVSENICCISQEELNALELSERFQQGSQQLEQSTGKNTDATNRGLVIEMKLWHRSKSIGFGVALAMLILWACVFSFLKKTYDL